MKDKLYDYSSKHINYKKTYDAIAECFAPILEVGNSSKSEVEFMDSFLAQLSSNSTTIDLGCGVW